MPEIIDVLPGEVMESLWGNQIRDRSVLRYANLAALMVSEPTPVAGRIAWLDDPGTLNMYDGANWARLKYTPSTPIVFSEPGLAVVTQGKGRFLAAHAMQITTVAITAGNAPTGADLIADINLNGTTIFTTQGNRPTIPDGSNYSAQVTPDIADIPADASLTVDIDQVGSTFGGENITLIVSLI